MEGPVFVYLSGTNSIMTDIRKEMSARKNQFFSRYSKAFINHYAMVYETSNRVSENPHSHKITDF